MNWRRFLRQISECKRRPAVELLGVAEHLADALYSNPHITGVAITGSLARLEPMCHDIDFIIFHDGELPDGSYVEPPDRYAFMYESPFRPLVEAIHDNRILGEIERARAGVPLNLCFVHEKILWDCFYLKGRDVSDKINVTEFFLRVLNSLPLLLLLPSRRRGGLHKFTESYAIVALDLGIGGLGVKYNAVRIGHRCENLGCVPKESWEEVKKRIKARKPHWQHLFR